MTTGEKLVALSTLYSGTAMEHLMNINTGGDCPKTSIGGGGGIENVTLEEMDGIGNIEDTIQEIDYMGDTPELDLDEIELDD